MQDVTDVFNDDLARRGVTQRFDPERIDDPGLKTELATLYPEAVPVGALTSAFAAGAVTARTPSADRP
jgi:hypothetical protein